MGRFALRPVPAALILAAVLHLAWLVLFANSGGDLSAQDAWAQFARAHPGSAYDLAWYGGMHPVSYSVISPYVMALLGVRTTLILSGVASAGLLALIAERSGALRRPLWPALFGAFALAANSVSGRVTFSLGVMFALAAVAVIWLRPLARRRLGDGVLAAVLAALATMASPVAGLFVGVVAAALWLQGRRGAAYTIGLPPVAVVALSALLFPFAGEQPMGPASMILPIALGIGGLLLTPRSWRTVRIGSGVYVLGVVAVGLVPSEIGTNVSRLALVFGGVVAVAALCANEPPQRPSDWREVFTPGRRWTAGVVAVVTATCWPVVVAAKDVVHTRSADQWTHEIAPIVRELDARGADLARVEVVPARSHREASALAPYVNLARGWNRQADAERNPLFYNADIALTSAAYRNWLDRWAVHYVFLPSAEPDPAAVQEAALISGGADYLRRVWTGPIGTLYAVRAAQPLVDPPAVVTRFDAAMVVLEVSKPGPVLVRIVASPWLTLVDAHGEPIPPPQEVTPGVAPVNEQGCLSREVFPASAERGEDMWTVLWAPRPGKYRIAAPYTLPRGTTCPSIWSD